MWSSAMDDEDLYEQLVDAYDTLTGDGGNGTAVVRWGF